MIFFIFLTLLTTVTPSNSWAASGHFTLIKLGVSRVGEYQSQTGDLQNEDKRAIEVQSGEAFNVGVEYWPSWYIGIGLEAKRYGKRKFISNAIGTLGGFSYYFTDINGEISELSAAAELLLRYPFKGGRFAMLGSYAKSKGRNKLEFQSNSIYTFAREEELDVSGEKLRVGLEYFFQRDAGLRVSWANYDETWEKSNALVLTQEKASVDYSELALEFLVLFH